MRFGFNTYANALTIPRELSLGATVTRIFVPWSTIELVPGARNWQQVDDQYRSALEAGLQPILVAFGSPCWTRLGGGCDDLLFNGPPDPAFDGQWTDFIRRTTIRYPRAAGIEIWNEPNLDQLFWPRADPVRYTKLLTEAYRAVKAVNQTMPVIGASLLTTPLTGTGPGGMADSTFLAAMYAAGAGTVMDAIGVHPYPFVIGADGGLRWDPSAMEARLDRLRTIRDAAGANSSKFWISEVGESTATQPGFPAAVSLPQQAADLVTMVNAVRADRDVPVMIIHTLDDQQQDPAEVLLPHILVPLTGISLTYNEIASGFGVFASNGKPKPAACALSREFGGSLNC